MSSETFQFDFGISVEELYVIFNGSNVNPPNALPYYALDDISTNSEYLKYGIAGLSSLNNSTSTTAEPCRVADISRLSGSTSKVASQSKTIVSAHETSFLRYFDCATHKSSLPPTTKDCSTNTESSFGVFDVTAQKACLPPTTNDYSTNTEGSSRVFDVAMQKVSLPPTTKDCSTNTDGESSYLLEILSKNFESFNECKNGTDSTLRVGEVQFPVHRAVLSALSPAFSAMFHHDTDEKFEGSEVDILHIDASLLGDVLYYVYSGKVRGLTAQTAASMYTVADRYSLIHLKKECLDFLKCSLTNDAALLAHIHGETDLVRRILQFIEEGIEKVLESNQWREFSTMKPSIANKLIGIALMSYRKKIVDKR